MLASPPGQRAALSQTDTVLRRAWGGARGTELPGGAGGTLAYAGQHWDADVGLSYAQQRWYQPEVGRFLSEDPVFGDVLNPTSLHEWGYANGNPLLFTDPEGTQGIPDYLKARRTIGLPTARDQCRKDITWIGCAAAVGAKIDGDYATYDQYIAEGECTPEFTRGFKACDMRPAQDAWYHSDIGTTTREFWTATPGRAQTMGCFIGGVNAITYGVPLAEVDTPRVDKPGAVRVEGCS